MPNFQIFPFLVLSSLNDIHEIFRLLAPAFLVRIYFVFQEITERNVSYQLSVVKTARFMVFGDKIRLTYCSTMEMYSRNLSQPNLSLS
jgi:hypothetical protein